MTTEQSKGLREFYAAVALANLPMPLRVAFDQANDRYEVALTFGSFADCAAWARASSAMDDIHTWRGFHGEDKMAGHGTFAGRKVFLLASEPTRLPEPLLDDATRARLEDVTWEVA